MFASGITRRNFIGAVGATGAATALMGMLGCSQQGQTSASASATSATSSASTGNTENAAASNGYVLNSAAWGYDEENDTYYQIGVQYCANPQAPSYESMGIYVPGAYFDATKNSDGTYTCTPSSTGTVAGYTAATAPVVMPINTAGYAAQAAPTSYSSDGLSDYLKAGFVYVFAGCRGRNMQDNACGAAPWGVTDLKAAIRTLRYNAASLPGDMSRIFSLGMSGGGAQSAVLGVSGDAPGYDDYLNTIGAPTQDAAGNKLSDAIFGSMCWCPITCLISADMAYEWNMGQFVNTGTRAEGTFTKQLSQDLAKSYAGYINALGLSDASGQTLSLTDGGEGIACSGSYYDHVKGQIERSLNNFLTDTEFPYTPSNKFNADMGAGGGGMGGAGGQGGARGQGGFRGSENGGGSSAMGDREMRGGPMGGGNQGQSDSSSTTTYETVADYIASLNGDDTWVAYDESTNTATITGLAGFVAHCKSASKDVGAFDALDRSQAENQVFGNAETSGLHYDAEMATLLAANSATYSALSNWNDSYPNDYKSDRDYIDEQGKTSDFRQELYDPLYYLSHAYEGAGTSTPSAHWRIRTGIAQGDTANTTEINLALALAAANGVADVDFETVWGQGHTMAERTGSSTANFIEWVNTCCK